METTATTSRTLPPQIRTFFRYVIRKACGFDELAILIIQESELKIKQMGASFQTTPEEISVFLGMNLVMSYHVVPSFRDYWSSDLDMQVSYIANNCQYNVSKEFWNHQERFAI